MGLNIENDAGGSGTIIFVAESGALNGRDFVRFPDGVMTEISGYTSSWTKAGFPVVKVTQHGGRLEALVEYSDWKREAFRRAAGA